MIWGTIRRSVASSWATANSVSRISPASIRQTCFSPAETMINANGFERLQTFSYSSLGVRVAATIPSMAENGTDGTFSKFLNKPSDGIEVNNSVSNGNKEKMAGGTVSNFSSGIYGSLFGTPIFNARQSAIYGMHSDKVGLSLGNKGLTVCNYSTDNKPSTPNSLRPLSPHLPVYKPQSNSMFSIFNRISASFLTAEILLVYLLLQIGSTSFTYYNFYQLFFYSSKLTLLATEITALAVAYHLVYGVGALVRPFRR